MCVFFFTASISAARMPRAQGRIVGHKSPSVQSISGSLAHHRKSLLQRWRRRRRNYGGLSRSPPPPSRPRAKNQRQSTFLLLEIYLSRKYMIYPFFWSPAPKKTTFLGIPTWFFEHNAPAPWIMKKKGKKKEKNRPMRLLLGKGYC